MLIKNYEKRYVYYLGEKNFTIGQSYWCFVLLWGGVKFKNNNKPFKITYNDSNVDTKTSKFGFEFEGKYAPSHNSTLRHNLAIGYFNDSYAYVFDTEEDAIDGYDDLLINIASNKDNHIKAKIYKQLIRKEAPNKKQFELDAIQWYENLSEEEQKYCKYIKYKYTNLQIEDSFDRDFKKY